MKNLKVLITPAYIAVIVGILTESSIHSLSIALYVIALVIGIILLIVFKKQSTKYYLIYPVLIYAAVEILNVIFAPQLLTSSYGKLYLLLFSIVVAYIAYRRNKLKEW